VTRIAWLVGAAALAAVIVVAAILISAGGADDGDDAPPARVERISQNRVFLGDPGACKGSLTIKAKSGKKKGTRRITIGSARFSGIARGTTKRVSVTLNRKGRKLLKKGKVKAIVAMKVSAGTATVAQSITRSMTLKKPKKARKS
jgi:hypothetical protein